MTTSAKGTQTYGTPRCLDRNPGELPGGSITAMFTGTNDVTTAYEESADGSWTLDGTFELDILEATGSYQSFVGGHVHMVDILKFRAGDGTFLEDCFCNIHPKLAKP